MNKLVGSLALLTALSAPAAFADRITSMVDNCDISKGSAYTRYQMDQLLEQGYKLITVIQLDNEPSPVPGYSPRKCSYIFAQQ